MQEGIGVNVNRQSATSGHFLPILLVATYKWILRVAKVRIIDTRLPLPHDALDKIASRFSELYLNTERCWAPMKMRHATHTTLHLNTQ